MSQGLTIIIPAFEEQNRVGDSIRKILDYTALTNLDAEVIVVDDGSGDNTKAVAEAACEDASIPCKVIRYEPNRGKGYAVKTGLLAATRDIALFTDADLSTPIEELPK